MSWAGAGYHLQVKGLVCFPHGHHKAAGTWPDQPGGLEAKTLAKETDHQTPSSRDIVRRSKLVLQKDQSA